MLVSLYGLYSSYLLSVSIEHADRMDRTNRNTLSPAVIMRCTLGMCSEYRLFSSNVDGLYGEYDPSTAGLTLRNSVAVLDRTAVYKVQLKEIVKEIQRRTSPTWFNNPSLYGFKAKMFMKDRAFLLVNEAKNFRLTKTKFSSRRHEISSYITNFTFDSSPSLRNIRRHFRTINSPKFRPFFV